MALLIDRVEREEGFFYPVFWFLPSVVSLALGHPQYTLRNWLAGELVHLKDGKRSDGFIVFAYYSLRVSHSLTRLYWKMTEEIKFVLLAINLM